MVLGGARMVTYELFIINPHTNKSVSARLLLPFCVCQRMTIHVLYSIASPFRLPAQRAPQLPFPIALQPGQNPSPLLSAGRGQGLWTPTLAQNPALAQTTALAQSAALSPATGSNLVQKALQLTAQIAKQNQFKNVMLPTVPPPRPTFTPILPLPVVEGDSDAAARLKEPLAIKTSGTAPQRVESVHSPQHVDSAPSPQQDETVPSPQPLKERHRMGSDDLLADEIIEKMEKSYSDDESKKYLLNVKNPVWLGTGMFIYRWTSMFSSIPNYWLVKSSNR